jgi:hypothetical protein
VHYLELGTTTPVTGPDADRERRAWLDRMLSGLPVPIHAVLAEPREAPVRLRWPGWVEVVDWPDGRPRLRVMRRAALERAEFGDRTPVDTSDLRCPPEVARLFAGKMDRADLHPLLQAALFPLAAPVPPRPPKPPRDRVKIQCAGAFHEVLMCDGTLRIPHTEVEVERERVLATLGGRMQGCFAAAAGWRDPAVRMPRQMRSLRANVLALVRHGDPRAMAEALDRGLDPTLRDERGRTLLHLLPYFPGVDLLPRLLAAGLDPAARDDAGSTPARYAQLAARPDLMQAFSAT